MNSTPRFMLISGYGVGRGLHIVRARVKASAGAVMNMAVEDVAGRRGSLVNSLIASAKGCSRPYGPTILGPFRSCMYPRTLRSTSVRNATARRTGRMSVRMLIINILLGRGFEPLGIKA